MAAAVTNIFAGLSLVLDRMSERRDEEAWLAEQAGCREARYLLLDATGESYLLPESEGLRWLSGAERNEWFADVPASLLGIAGGCPHFLLALEEAHPADALEERRGPVRLCQGPGPLAARDTVLQRLRGAVEADRRRASHAVHQRGLRAAALPAHRRGDHRHRRA
jgi:hypothetical protein